MKLIKNIFLYIFFILNIDSIFCMDENSLTDGSLCGLFYPTKCNYSFKGSAGHMMSLIMNNNTKKIDMNELKKSIGDEYKSFLCSAKIIVPIASIVLFYALKKKKSYFLKK